MQSSLIWSRRIALGTLAIGLAACVAVTDDDGGATAPAPEVGVLKERILEPVSQLAPPDLPSRALEGTGQLVRFNRDALQAGRVEFVTAEGMIFTAAHRQTAFAVPESQTWGGEVEGHPGSDFFITELRGTVSGFAHVGTRTFEIETDAKGRLYMFEVDPAKILPDDPEHHEGMLLDEDAQDGEEAPGAGAPADGAPSASADTAPSAAGAAAAAHIIDVLVIYTPKARSLYGKDGLESKILSTIAYGNQAYVNSNIDVQLNLVHMAEIAYTETNDIQTSLARVRSTTDGHMDGVHALRDQVGADVVALVTEDADANWCGYGYIMRNNSTNFAKDAFSVTKASCLANNTLPHEIGHNQGSQHDRETAAGAYGMYAFSYGYRRCTTDGTGFRTIMAYSCNGAARIAHFSNPSVRFNGLPTGIDYAVSPSTSADNARSMRATAATMTNLRSTPDAPTAPPVAPTGIAASATSSSTITLTWTDASDNEAGFYVERSTGGGSFMQIAAVGPGAKSYANTGLAASTAYSYRVRAYNSVGASAYTAVVSATTLAPAPATPPTRPSNVTSTVSGGQVTVRWVDRSNNEDLFEIERAQKIGASWGAYSPLANVARNVTSYVDAPSRGTWRYRVRAANSGGASAWTASGMIVVN